MHGVDGDGGDSSIHVYMHAWSGVCTLFTCCKGNSFERIKSLNLHLN